jgi:hypothetical protein
VIIFVVYVVYNSSMYFYRHYYTCENVTNYECVEIQHSKLYKNIEWYEDYYIDTSWEYDVICKLNYCLSMNSAGINSRKWAIENRWIKDLIKY